MLTMMTMQSPLGALRLFAHVDELVGVYLPDQPAPDAAPAQRPTRVLAVGAAQLAEYFAGERQEFDLAVRPVGTNFQQLVWRALTRIPFGETWTYGELARAIGRPSASRAVGAANSKNPLSIIVPCHRVIGASGELTGYAGGMPAKRWLLDHERGCSTSMHGPRAPSSLLLC
jgi:methylated-DNA-[protein]-cysteine S-methyltransferase